ncbi:MAG: SAM-dependent methyltransferase [Gammaproteobacteria bacterium CG11_big_fil_rev_8_21_14_0_20_46_22]|nr:MAG: SAM-dependent methyltransferase [Gammaproteobacteria bacterium CG12_big_fil_rev_8_21_14_0_65_46_12]PIR11419.1 MAG: SAM-dependent methyltransferase [Gammaproteobacteria bacterium CG11_big_fil_rev_8_21_14_0_20_46_22]
MSEYTIHSEQIAPHEELLLALQSHQSSVWRRPIAAHQIEVFEQARAFMVRRDAPIILDSGCGTGMSSQILAEQFSEHTVIGLDKSLLRLSKADKQLPDNVRLFRADVRDFWRLFVEAGLKADWHYLLYPNPYPKKVQFKKRWPAHPVFPVLAHSADRFEVRSNWRVYLDEWEIALHCLRPKSATRITRLDASVLPMTRFEQKYFKAGEACYRLINEVIIE